MGIRERNPLIETGFWKRTRKDSSRSTKIRRDEAEAPSSLISRDWSAKENAVSFESVKMSIIRTFVRNVVCVGIYISHDPKKRDIICMTRLQLFALSRATNALSLSTVSPNRRKTLFALFFFFLHIFSPFSLFRSTVHRSLLTALCLRRPPGRLLAPCRWRRGFFLLSLLPNWKNLI